MASIELSTTGNTWAIGWFGTCADESPYPLATIKEHIGGVYQINENEDSLDVWFDGVPDYQKKFEHLHVGYMYWIIFNKATTPTTIEIPGFINPRFQGMDMSSWPFVPKDPGDGEGKVVEGCVSVLETIPPASIELSTTGNTWAIGWFGTCAEESPYPLATIKEHIGGVYQINENEDSLDVWFDGVPDYQKKFEHLHPGYAYWIIFNKATTPTTIEIPGFINPRFQGMDMSSWPFVPKDPGDGSGRVVEDCGGAPQPTPTPTAECFPTVELSADKSSLRVIIDWAEFINSNNANGTVKAVEVVFDNVEFMPKATTSPSRIAGFDPEIVVDWDGHDNQDITAVREWTGVYKDMSIRNNASMPTMKTTTFAVFSLSTNGQSEGISLSTYASSKFTFDIPVMNIDGDVPILAEIRAYDSSVDIVDYEYTVKEC